MSEGGQGGGTERCGDGSPAPPSSRRRLLQHSITCGWILLTAVALLVPRNPDLGDHFGWLPVPVDKAGHFLLFFVCTLLLHRSLRLERRPAPLLLAAVLSLGYALSTEALQGFVPRRAPDPADAAADGLGIVLYVGWALREWLPCGDR